MSNDSNKAACIFSEGYNCAQAVLAACGEKYGLEKDMAIRLGQAFGGGIGRTGNICGAVSGALMCIGLKHSVKDGSDLACKKKAHLLAQRFIAEFEKENHSILCRELLGCEILSDEGQKLAAESGIFKEHCPKLVKDAARIIDAILEA